MAAARAGLGNAAFNAAFTVGRAMSLDETVELVKASRPEPIG